MFDLSPRLGLPFLAAAQAQKHVTHNEALLRIDHVTQLTLEALDATEPPVSPTEGQVWALGSEPIGDWAGQAGNLALWFDGIWHFVPPGTGWQATLQTALRVFDGTAWVAPDLPVLQGLPGVGINASHDAVNRLSVSSDATLLNHDGAGHQLKLNKATIGDTASLLFQTGFSGRAEMGTAGSDDFSVKVSPDGSDWFDALTVDRFSGHVALPQGLSVNGDLNLPAASVARTAMAEGAGLALLGRAANSTGPLEDIAAGSNHQVMRRSGNAIGFGALALNQSAAVTGLLPLTNGGTGAATATAARTNLGLGTAATATVVTSAIDSTAGRLPVVGWMGLGTISSPTLADLDSFTIPQGFHHVSNATTAGTLPPTNTVADSVIVLKAANNHSTQIYSIPNIPGTFLRTSSSNTAWGPWRRIYDQGTILGTVSQSGGAPTGALIQRGSNANGEFVRFADGTQICTHSLNSSSSGETTWAYPAAFATTSGLRFLLSVNSTIGSFISARGTNRTATSLDFSVFNASGRVAAAVELFTIGRWI